jgi:hypothetical protein
VPVWQSIYEEINDPNFVIISAAQDTGGEEAAGPIFDKANVTYTAIVDVNHTISSLYNFVNVPSAAWIDEEGRVVRIDEGTYTKAANVMGQTIGNDDYLPALKDWLKNGSDSPHIYSQEKVASQIRVRNDDETLAEPTFKMAAYFYLNDDMERANAYWDKAEVLSPDSWNFHRQDWSFLEMADTMKNFMGKVNALKDEGRDYYAPMELEPSTD